MRTPRISFLILLFLLYQSNFSFCQVVYSFTGNGNWSSVNNWSNNVKPPAILPAGSEIVIDPISTGECVLDIQQTILPGATFTIKANGKFRIIHDFTFTIPPVNGDTTVQSAIQKLLVATIKGLGLATVSTSDTVSATSVIRKGDVIAMKYFDDEVGQTYDFILNEASSNKDKMVFEGKLFDEYNTDELRRTVTFISPTKFLVEDEQKDGDGYVPRETKEYVVSDNTVYESRVEKDDGSRVPIFIWSPKNATSVIKTDANNGKIYNIDNVIIVLK